MKRFISLTILVSFLSYCAAQDCTKAIAALQPSIYEKVTGYNGNRLKDPYQKKIADEIHGLLFAALKDATGLHAFYDNSINQYSTGKLLAFDTYIFAHSIYCQKDGGFNWKGLWGFEVRCRANYIRPFADPVYNEDVGVGGNKDVLLNNSPVYTTKDLRSHSEIKGFPYYATTSYEGVFITKPGVPLFRTITRKDYLVILRKSEEAILANLKKNLADFLQTKTTAAPGTAIDKGNKEVEELNNKLINDTVKDIAETDRLLTTRDNTWLNKPCITAYRLVAPLSHSFDKEKDYFSDITGGGNEWVIINPDYLSKNAPATAPQFFYVDWGECRSIAEKKAGELMKTNFDFAKLAAMLK